MTQSLDRELLQVAVAMNRVRAMYQQPWVSMTYRITCQDGLRPRGSGKLVVMPLFVMTFCYG